VNRQNAQFTHLAGMISKLDMHKTSALVKYAVKAGLL
jgi:hypothetical protein